jgi:hypothetical protein
VTTENGAAAGGSFDPGFSPAKTVDLSAARKTMGAAMDVIEGADAKVSTHADALLGGLASTVKKIDTQVSAFGAGKLAPSQAAISEADSRVASYAAGSVAAVTTSPMSSGFPGGSVAPPVEHGGTGPGFNLPISVPGVPVGIGTSPTGPISPPEQQYTLWVTGNANQRSCSCLPAGQPGPGMYWGGVGTYLSLAGCLMAAQAYCLPQPTPPVPLPPSPIGGPPIGGPPVPVSPPIGTHPCEPSGPIGPPITGPGAGGGVICPPPPEPEWTCWQTARGFKYCRASYFGPVDPTDTPLSTGLGEQACRDCLSPPAPQPPVPTPPPPCPEGGDVDWTLHECSDEQYQTVVDQTGYPVFDASQGTLSDQLSAISTVSIRPPIEYASRSAAALAEILWPA